MAGRPLGLRSLVRALSQMSPAQVKKLLASAPAARGNGKLERLERQREKHVAAIKKLDRQIAEVSGGNGSVADAPPRRGRKPGRRKGYKLSAATRRQMSEAARRRYAVKGRVEAPAPRKRRTMSSETRAKMAAAARARWAKVKGASIEGSNV